jgi:hypothetical protein
VILKKFIDIVICTAYVAFSSDYTYRPVSKYYTGIIMDIVKAVRATAINFFQHNRQIGRYLKSVTLTSTSGALLLLQLSSCQERLKVCALKFLDSIITFPVSRSPKEFLLTGALW